MKHPYKNKMFPGSTFPDQSYDDDVRVTLSREIIDRYIPALNGIGDIPKGLRLLMIIMAQKEGFRKGTRSFRTNNPGNIANTDAGKDRRFWSLEDGIRAQRDYLIRVASGKHRSYPIGKKVEILPYFSKEIAKNQKTYGISPHLPGYSFVYTGQIDQFVKIYSTGARATNGYINLILSFFKNHGIEISPETTLQEIIYIS